MTTKQFIEKNLNLTWLIAVLITIGGYIAIIKMQGDVLAEHSREIEMIKVDHTKDINCVKDQSSSIDKRLVRMETMMEGIQKDVSDIRRIVLRPSFNSRVDGGNGVEKVEKVKSVDDEVEMEIAEILTNSVMGTRKEVVSKN